MFIESHARIRIAKSNALPVSPKRSLSRERRSGPSVEHMWVSPFASAEISAVQDNVVNVL